LLNHRRSGPSKIDSRQSVGEIAIGTAILSLVTP
jgi:hypothetical protein